jgi:hypothetical protein
MPALLRIYKHPNMTPKLGGATIEAKEPETGTELKKYTDRLVRLVPAEIVGLYLAGRTAITGKFPPNTTPDPNAILSEPAAWIVWSLVCLVLVVGVRTWMTSDASRNVPPEKWTVIIATVSFVIWVYSFGDVFRIVFHVWDSLLATFLVLAWTFIVPAVYGRDA